ncbi:MAG: hypothetical protein IPN78_05860 [Candidatus Accumulibacter sp.]|nr:hypothetical protein [Candidatus Accumulibacter propinquus]
MDEPGSVYLSLKLAAKLFGKPLESLAPDELHRVKPDRRQTIRDRDPDPGHSGSPPA